ncbi:MAG: protein jag [Clostridium sp.]|uniref:RNA-binding cell elongation regulator Jag/EloR n=1 Tax=Clostridium sp. DSM 8431 TaxID=1761781 RepID=UPI0008F39B38|nr:RNA-binding cell elongation regulator Jag/EloR [Clostridium sp. DSM 8431]MCR4943119.1 protein jag [Clostridium sp.]SFU61290.1 spoIIIJ-associated protein [Clostridium sp. DSM 8431]
MKSIDMTGKNVDEALEKALHQLNATKDEVKVEIIDEGVKGFLNIIGSKPAKVRVTLKKNYVDEAKEFLKNVFDKMNVKAEIFVEENDDNVYIELVGSNMGSIIGYRGETLDALQYLVSLVVNKNHDAKYKRIILDAEHYRSKREETLKRVAYKTADKVRKRRKAFKLEPMNPYERRIIHSALQDSNDIVTYSEGEEPRRRVVIDIE